jgi:hypothetical protein
LAHDNDLAPRLVAQAKSCLNVPPKLTADLERQGADPAMLARVREVIERQAAEAICMVPMTQEVDPALF